MEKNTITSQNKFHLIIPASGVGSRFNSDIPKQYIKMFNNKTILDNTIEKFIQNKNFDKIIISLHPSDIWFKHSIFYKHQKIITVTGGKERFLSVENALNKLSTITDINDFVAVHDSVRPCILQNDINNIINKIKNHQVGGLLVSPIVDTIKLCSKTEVKKTIQRENMYYAQTPQIYRINLLLQALKKIKNDKVQITDDASSIEYLGLKSLCVIADKNNIKITTKNDLKLANFILQAQIF